MNNMTLISILIMGILSAMIGLAFNKIQQPNMIFAPYRKWLDDISNKEFKSLRFRLFEFKIWLQYNTTFKIIDKANLEYLMLHKDKWYNDSTKSASSKSKLLDSITKPLGLCIVCNTFWIGVIITLLFIKDTNFIQLIVLCIITGLSSIGFLDILNNG